MRLEISQEKRKQRLCGHGFDFHAKGHGDMKFIAFAQESQIFSYDQDLEAILEPGTSRKSNQNNIARAAVQRQGVTKSDVCFKALQDRKA